MLYEDKFVNINLVILLNNLWWGDFGWWMCFGAGKCEGGEHGAQVGVTSTMNFVK